MLTVPRVSSAIMSIPSALKSSRTAWLIPVSAWVGAIALSVRYLSHIWRDRLFETTRLPIFGRTLSDFRDTVWLPTRDFLGGGNPYDTLTYLERHPSAQEFGPYTPGHLLLWSPMGLIPWDVATAIYLVLSGLVVCAVGAWGGARVLRQVRPRAGAGELVTASAAGVIVLWLTRTVLASVSPGQPSTFYSLLAVPAVIGIRSKLGTAFLVGVACMKPQIGLPVLVILLAQRRTAALVSGLGVATVLSVPAVLLLAHGPAGLPAWTSTFLRSAEMSRVSPYTGGAAATLYRIDLEALGLSLGRAISTPALAAITVSTLILGWGAQRAGDRLGVRYVGTTLALAVGLLPLSHGYYDACWLVIPLALAVAQLAPWGTRAIRFSLAPGLVLLTLTQFTSSPRIDSVLGHGFGVAAERALLLGGVLALGIGLAVGLAKRAVLDEVSS
jgi:hypothetical protein